MRDDVSRLSSQLSDANQRLSHLQSFRTSVARTLHLRDLPETDLLHRLQALCSAHQEFTMLSKRYETASPVGDHPCPRFDDPIPPSSHCRPPRSSVLRQLPSTIRRPSIQAAAITHHRLSIIMVPAAMCTITTDMDTDTVTHRIPGGSEVKAGTNDSTMSASTRMCIDCTMAARRSYWPPDRRMTMTSRANTARVVNFFFAFVFCQNNSE